MKQLLIGLIFSVVCLVGALPAAHAEMVYTEIGGGGGGGSWRQAPNHIDFALQYNKTSDSSNGVKDGGGLWIGYRHSVVEIFSIGAKLGAHSFSIDNSGNHDTVAAVPLLITGQFERNFNHVFNIFAQIGMGPSFNKISGDATDLLGLKLKTSFAFDLCFGGTFEMNQNIAIGANFDWFLSSAGVKSNSALTDDHLNISHFGIGFLLVGSF